MAVKANEKSIRIENVLIQDKNVLLYDNQSNMKEKVFFKKTIHCTDNESNSKEMKQSAFFDLNK